MEGRKVGRVVIDEIEHRISDPQSSENELAASQAQSDISLATYSTALIDFCNALALNGSLEEKRNALLTPITTVIFCRKLLRAKGVDLDTLYTLENALLAEITEEALTSVDDVLMPIGAPQALTGAPTDTSLFARIRCDLLVFLHGYVNSATSMHKARFKELYDKIEKSTSIEEAYAEVYNAKYEVHAEQNITTDGSELRASPQTKLETKSNQTWIGGFFRRVIYDDQPKTYEACFRIFNRHKDCPEMKSVLRKFPELVLTSSPTSP